MNPETKIILDELHRRFAEHDQKWDARLADQDSRFTHQIQELERAQEHRVAALERITASIDDWRPSIEGLVDDLRDDVSKSKLEVSKLSRNWERAVLDQPALKPGILSSAPPAVEASLHGAPATSPKGHGVERCHRESGFGVVTTQIHSPVKGIGGLAGTRHICVSTTAGLKGRVARAAKILFHLH